MAERTIQIPEDVELRQEGKALAVKGPKGQLTREFIHGKIKIAVKDKKLLISSEEDRRQIKAIVGTWAAIINNMILGVSKGWKCEMKLVFSHFPAKMSLKDGEFVIQNFLGERAPRSAKLFPDVSVKIDKENIIITGADKERVGLAAGKIEKVTKIVGYDRRIFQDGCFIVKHPYLEN